MDESVSENLCKTRALLTTTAKSAMQYDNLADANKIPNSILY